MGASAKQPSKQYHHKKGIFTPLPSISSLFRLPRSSAHSPLPSILSVSNRHWLHRPDTLSPYTHARTYRITSHRTALCISGWTGCYRAECPFCQQGDLQTIHGCCTHSHLPPSHSLSLSLTSLPRTHYHLCEDFQYAREQRSRVMACSFCTCSKECTLST